jgi:putative hydrolase of the HAD superfamily
MSSKLIFWDWTGTLANEAELDKSVCATMEREYARKQNISLEEAADFYRQYLKKIENTWNWHDYVTHCRDMGIDWKSCQTDNLDKLFPVPGAGDILAYAQTRGYRNVLATNAVRLVIELRLDYVGLGHFFDLIVASDDVRALKSEGKHFLRGLSKLGGTAASCLSVGDNPVQDIQPAQSLGLKTVFCTYGRKLTHYHSDHISDNHREQVRSAFRIAKLTDIKYIL